MTRRPKPTMLESVGYAMEGLAYTVREERNARIHLVMGLGVIGLGIWLHLDHIEWALVIVSIALVFVGEMLNTVVELTIDLVSPEYHILAKYAKDVAAGAILVASFAAAVIGLFVLGPPLLDRLGLHWF